MKNNSLFIFLVSPVFSQELEINSTEVVITGHTRIDPAGPGYTDLIFDNTGYYNGAAFRPEGNYASNVGTSAHQFKYMYGMN
ncbi:MAG: hypothetical protein JXB49_33335 [Bacteroidales bacterium]|nr:hypothetical protein [Bacteroidales bacterium]MBN2817454.1 hypothetical protein [Bacteroidales bacterium]